MDTGMGGNLGVVFRRAGAGDAEASAPLVHASGPDSFDYVFGGRRGGAQAYLRYALARPRGDFGFATHVVGERDGRVVAAGAGWCDGGIAMARATGLSLLAYFGPFRFAGVVRRGLRAEAVMPGPHQGEYYIGHLGIDPALRGCGIGGALLRYLLEAGQAAGAARAVLDVSVENPRAEALYTRVGFRVVKTRESDLANVFGRVPGHRRMVRELGA